ncbi:MAG: TonB-dependent receptor [Dokdonella sp.]
MNRSRLFFPSALLVLAAPIQAQDDNLQPQIVVTASRVAQTIDATMADVSIITRDAIDASASRDLVDVLRLQAGVDIARTGGPGGQTSVFLRGTNNNHVLVLIDGIRVAALGTGAFTWETLPLDTIERIEIVRGPRASYWGSDAIGGVVQIFTRALEGPRVSLGYGTHGDRNANAGFGRRGERGGFSVQAGARDYDGFPSQNENGFAFEDKDHGLDNQHLTARGDLRFVTQKLSANLLRSEGTAEFSGGESDFVQQAIGVALEGALGERWQHRLSAGSAREDYSTPAFFSAFDSRRDTLAWQNDVQLGERQRLILGIDRLDEEGENRDTFSGTAVYREQRDNTGLFAGWHAGFVAFDSELSVRHDDNSVFGGNTTGSAAIGWRFAAPWRAYASHGEGFRGPTLNEQYSPGFGGLFAGNSELQPEASRSSELGIEYAPVDGQRFKTNLYETRVRNLISFSGVDFQAVNVARARIKGAELDYQGSFSGWLVTATLTWQDPRNEDTNSALLRRPKQKFTSMIERRFSDTIRAGIELVHAGKRNDVGGIELASYTLINLRGTWSPVPDWRIAARLENITDRDHELAFGYNTPGRTGMIDVIWAPR